MDTADTNRRLAALWEVCAPSAAAAQPIRWHSATAEIIEFPDPHPPYKLPNGKLWNTLIQLQKGGFVRVMRDPLGVLRFCAVKLHTTEIK